MKVNNHFYFPLSIFHSLLFIQLIGPNQIDYHQNVAKHDAFPSGHLAAATATSTVIILNYSDDYPIVKPICVGLLTALSYQMMNNGVHWAGDYPLALALGYSFGKIAVTRGRTKKSDKKDAITFTAEPTVLAGGSGLKGTWRF